MASAPPAMTLTSCQHCGKPHDVSILHCPRTGQPMNEAGPVGAVIDRYRVLELCGGGGFGAVYRAEHTVMGRVVALKVLRRERANASTVARFFSEAKAAAAIGSPHIVQVYDAGTAADGTHFLAMEFIEGCSLGELLEQEGPLSLPRAGNIVLQVLEALRAAHGAGIIHRDVKPGNIMLEGTHPNRGTPEDLVRLVDFGISKLPGNHLSPLTHTGTTMGTAGFAAPEQYSSASRADERADLYAVAVLLFAMLTRDLPHRGASYEEMVVSVCTKPPRTIRSLRSELPESLEMVVQRGLAREPNDRPSSAQEMADALRVVLAGYVADNPTPRISGIESTVAATLPSTLPLIPKKEIDPAEPWTADSGVRSTGRTVPRSRSNRILWGLALLTVGAVAAVGGGYYASNGVGNALPNQASHTVIEETAPAAEARTPTPSSVAEDVSEKTAEAPEPPAQHVVPTEKEAETSTQQRATLRETLRANRRRQRASMMRAASGTENGLVPFDY